MFHLFKTADLKKTLATEIVPFTVAMLVAESYYKFGSFVIECFSFLITWYVLSGITSWIISQARRTQR